MKVLQIIDSLNAGGAERMAVTYANMLQERGISSFLCCTREEGLLKDEIKPGVEYIFLNKKSTFHLKPIFQLQKFIKRNKITIVHAHGTSFFTATLQKLLKNDLKLVWHDHYGLSEELQHRKFSILKKCSAKFDAVISVNEDLKEWASKNLKVDKVYYLSNFLSNSEETLAGEKKLLGGNSFKIICLANFRPQKNHFLLIEAFEQIQKQHGDVTLHLFGKNWRDDYFFKVKKMIAERNLEDKVYYYGSQSGVYAYLEKCDLGILSSNSEGLPMALLEYGQAGLPVVVTDVGQCKKVVGSFGKVVEPRNTHALAAAVLHYLENPLTMKLEAKQLQDYVKKNYTVDAVFPKLQTIYKNL